MSNKLRKDDVVEVIAGDYSKANIESTIERKDSGVSDAPARKTRGRILDINRKKGTVVIEGVNFKVHHDKVRQSEGGQEGGRNYREAPINISNVAIVDPASDKPARIGFEVRDGKKVRVTKGKNGGSVLDNQ